MHLSTVSIGAASTYIPSNCAKAFLSLHILLNSCYFFFWIKAFLEDLRWYLIVVLICVFWWVIVLSAFSCIIGKLYVFFKKMSIQVFCPLKKIRLFVFCYWVVWVPCIFWIIILTRNTICKYFFQFHRLLFHFVDGFLNWAVAF